MALPWAWLPSLRRGSPAARLCLPPPSTEPAAGQGAAACPDPLGSSKGGAAVLLPTPRPEEGAFILAAAQPLQQDPPPAVPQLPLEIPRAPITPHHFFLLLSALLLLHFG